MTLTAADRLDIQDTLSRYCWALDTGDVDEFAACFATGGELVWDVFAQPGTWRGQQALRHFARFFRDEPATAGRQHHLSNIVIGGTGEAATARSYVFVALARKEGPHALHVMGWYEDELVREDGRWVIARRVIRDWGGEVLGAIAGQDGQRVARDRPVQLDALFDPPA